jgi:hypothetical protein
VLDVRQRAAEGPRERAIAETNGISLMETHLPRRGQGTRETSSALEVRIERVVPQNVKSTDSIELDILVKNSSKDPVAGGCPKFCVSAVPHKIERKAWNEKRKMY